MMMMMMNWSLVRGLQFSLVRAVWTLPVFSLCSTVLGQVQVVLWPFLSCGFSIKCIHSFQRNTCSELEFSSVQFGSFHSRLKTVHFPHTLSTTHFPLPWLTPRSYTVPFLPSTSVVVFSSFYYLLFLIIWFRVVYEAALRQLLSKRKW